MAYIDQGSKESSCIFCDRFSARDPREALVLVRTRHSLVMLNKYPYNNGHLLIAPQRHEKHLSDLSAEEYGDMSEALRHSVDIVREVLQPE
jgi:ATP adenylyltransferase